MVKLTSKSQQMALSSEGGLKHFQLSSTVVNPYVASIDHMGLWSLCDVPKLRVKRSPILPPWPFRCKQGTTNPKGVLWVAFTQIWWDLVLGSIEFIALHLFQLVVPNILNHAQFTTHQIQLSCRSVISLPCYDDDGVYLGILGVNGFLTNRCR